MPSREDEAGIRHATRPERTSGCLIFTFFSTGSIATAFDLISLAMTAGDWSGIR
jgi:hypothetical protein